MRDRITATAYHVISPIHKNRHSSDSPIAFEVRLDCWPSIRLILNHQSFIPLQAVSELKDVLKVLDETGNQIYKNAEEVMLADKVNWSLESEKNPSIIASLCTNLRSHYSIRFD